MNDEPNFSDALAAAPPRSAGAWTPARLGITAALVVATLWLGWKAWDVNTTMACWKNEWPQLAMCDDINGRTLEEKVARLEQRLAQNPGDTLALVALTVYAHQPDAPAHLDPAALLERAGKVAPQQVDVLRLQAHHAMKAQRWTAALDALIRLSQYHGDAEATRTLTEMINFARVNGEVGKALVAAARADTGWLDRVLRALPAAKVPTVVAMPLIQQLVEQKTLTPKLGLALIRQLKAEDQWLDAHALWMQLWNKPLPMLFNGDFEQPFLTGGFDWETPGSNDHRAGAQVSLSGRKERGQVMRVEFRGKALSTPIVRQILMLPPGHYRFTGEYQATELRSEQGLAWVFACAGSRGEITRVPSLKTTGRDWKRMDVALEVPPECGFGVSLGLQPQADFEARTGMRGEMLFDNFQLSMETPP
ncbi:hypothetical protein [Hydrogenophaga sp. MI9]|uniref:hypothetical protein n=1 Tax=Hydrogenophaga sp. MI9 TaxID=3453719 RepID=UPI003EEB9DBB